MILTLGCSFTYGAELPGIDRETLAWPYVLASMLNTTVNNQVKNGASPSAVFRAAIEDPTEYELVVIEWPDPSRLEIWDSVTNTPINVNVSSLHNTKPHLSWVKDYYTNSFDDLFSYKVWYSQVLALQEYYKSRNQRYLFFPIAGLKGRYHDYKDDLSYLWDRIDTDKYIGWPMDGFVEFQGDCPKAPGGHPLELGHKRVAERIYEHIRDLGWLP